MIKLKEQNKLMLIMRFVECIVKLHKSSLWRDNRGDREIEKRGEMRKYS